MSAALEIQIESGPLERVDGDLVAVGFFSDDRPLRGGAARVDWRLCGLISELLLGGRLRGGWGEALLLPSSGQLRAPRILLLGLGERAGFRVTAARDAMRDAVARGLALGIHRLTIEPLGIASDDFPRHAQAVIGGALEAVREGSAEVQLRLVIRGSELERAFRALESAIHASAANEVRLYRPVRPPAAPTSVPRGRSAPS